jgi:hypothetical protein
MTDKLIGIDLLLSMTDITDDERKSVLDIIDKSHGLMDIYYNIARKLLGKYEGTSEREPRNEGNNYKRGFELLYNILYKHDHKGSNSLYELAMCYKIGKGCEKDENKTFELLSMGNKLNSNISLGLADCYRDGIGCTVDYKKAYELYSSDKRMRLDYIEMNIDQMKDYIKRLENRLDELEIEVNYRPEGKEYLKARDHYRELLKSSN